MPIYEYQCEKCGRIEVIQKATDKDLKNCPQCSESGKKSKVEKLVSAAAFHLKGTGWYKTDYASSGSGGSSKTKSGAVKSSETPTETAKSSDTSKAAEAPKTPAVAAKKCGGGCSCH